MEFIIGNYYTNNMVSSSSRRLKITFVRSFQVTLMPRFNRDRTNATFTGLIDGCFLLCSIECQTHPGTGEVHVSLEKVSSWEFASSHQLRGQLLRFVYLCTYVGYERLEWVKKPCSHLYTPSKGTLTSTASDDFKACSSLISRNHKARAVLLS